MPRLIVSVERTNSVVYQTLLADAMRDASDASADLASAAARKTMSQEEWEATQEGAESLAGKFLPLAR